MNTLKVQKSLDLTNIQGLQDISDSQAESCIGGAFIFRANEGAMSTIAVSSDGNPVESSLSLRQENFVITDTGGGPAGVGTSFFDVTIFALRNPAAPLEVIRSDDFGAIASGEVVDLTETMARLRNRNPNQNYVYRIEEITFPSPSSLCSNNPGICPFVF